MSQRIARSKFTTAIAASIALVTLGACGDQVSEGPVADSAPATPATTEPAPAASDTPLEDKAEEKCGPVTSRGYCGIAWGMDVSTATEVFLGAELEGGPGPGMEESCYFLRESGTQIAAIMILDGEVSRIDVPARGISTESGAEVGTSDDELAILYPQLTESVNQYTARDEAVVNFENGARAIFEMDEDGYVTRYRVGIPPGIDNVEGCS